MEGSLIAVMCVIAGGAVTLAAETIEINDARPVNAATLQLENRCHCVITYEDPVWRSDQVMDISGSVAHRSEVHPYGPRGGHFSFSVAEDLSQPSQASKAVKAMLEAFDRSFSAGGAFRVVEQAGTLHVIPSDGSVLDVSVTLGGPSATLNDVIHDVLKQVHAATDRKVLLGTFPSRAMSLRIPIGQKSTSAGEALASALASTGLKLSWELRFSYTMTAYYLSIHLVH
ncbi:MAG TPA: hypothetical protein VH583_05305 [Vicinamibacterales bacterium]|jgi:hypothetical protein